MGVRPRCRPGPDTHRMILVNSNQWYTCYSAGTECLTHFQVRDPLPASSASEFIVAYPMKKQSGAYERDAFRVPLSLFCCSFRLWVHYCASHYDSRSLYINAPNRDGNGSAFRGAFSPKRRLMDPSGPGSILPSAPLSATAGRTKEKLRELLSMGFADEEGLRDF